MPWVQVGRPGERRCAPGRLGASGSVLQTTGPGGFGCLGTPGALLPARHGWKEPCSTSRTPLEFLCSQEQKCYALEEW